jgi:hypothetical protein
MNDHGNRYAEAALKHRRALIAGEIHALTKQIQSRRKQLALLDATLRIFDPEYKEGSVKAKRYQRAPLFSQGELGRTILDVLREANGGPLAAPEIAVRAMAKFGTPAAARTAVASRIRSNPTYLKKQGKVTKAGDKLTARWALA